MTDTRTEHTPGKDTRLWCLHHIGADEMHPAPDFKTAQGWANWANRTFAEHADISRFVVAVWPWDAEAHASGVDKAVAEWTVPNSAKVYHLGTVLQAIADFHADILTPRQVAALYDAAKKLWDGRTPGDPA